MSGSVMNTLWVVDDALTVLGGLDPTSSGVTGYAYGTGECIGDVDGDGTVDVIFCPSDSGYLVTCTVAYGSAAGLVASGRNLVVHTSIYQVAGTGKHQRRRPERRWCLRLCGNEIRLCLHRPQRAGNGARRKRKHQYLGYILHTPTSTSSRTSRAMDTRISCFPILATTPGTPTPTATATSSSATSTPATAPSTSSSAPTTGLQRVWQPGRDRAAETANPPPPCLSTLRV